jgi:hypothetical protein
MDRKAEDDLRFRRYVLNGMSLGDATAVEERYLEDEETFERLRAAEDALIEEYWRGRLSPEERERFEAHYLASPVRRERADVVRMLIERAARPAQPRRMARAWAPWLAQAAAAVVVVAGAVLALRWIPAPPKPPAAEAPSPAAEPSWLELRPGLRRSAASQVVALPDGPGALRLQLDLPRPGDAALRVLLQTAEGREVWRSDRIEPRRLPQGTALRLEIPRAAVDPGDYVLSVRGPTEAGLDAEYFFRIRP